MMCFELFNTNMYVLIRYTSLYINFIDIILKKTYTNYLNYLNNMLRILLESKQFFFKYQIHFINYTNISCALNISLRAC